MLYFLLTISVELNDDLKSHPVQQTPAALPSLQSKYGLNGTDEL